MHVIIPDNKSITNDVTFTFTGTITEIYDQTALVHVDEGESLNPEAEYMWTFQRIVKRIFMSGIKLKSGMTEKCVNLTHFKSMWCLLKKLNDYSLEKDPMCIINAVTKKNEKTGNS